MNETKASVGRHLHCITAAINGDDDTMRMIKQVDLAFIFLYTSPHVSTLLASRRKFEVLKSEDIQTSVIHHFLTDSTDSNGLAFDMGIIIVLLLTDVLGMV